MKLDAAQLAAFAAVVEEGSFDAAAQRLHITPSAVSQRVKALEVGVGQVLVKRSRPAQPTQAGQLLARLAGQISLLESDVLSELMGGGAGGRYGEAVPARLRMPVAVNADSLATWFLPALADLPAEHAMTFDIRQEDQDHSIALLRDGSVMAAVTTEPRAVQGCRVLQLGAMRYLAVAAPDYRRRYLASDDVMGNDVMGDGEVMGDALEERDRASVAGASVPTPALATAPILMFNRKDGLQHRFAHAAAGRKVDPPVTYVPSSWGFVEAARLGLGWGMVPEQMARPELEAGRLIELRPGRPLDVALYWQRWRLESTALSTLTEVVRNRCARELVQTPRE